MYVTYPALSYQDHVFLNIFLACLSASKNKRFNQILFLYLDSFPFDRTKLFFTKFHLVIFFPFAQNLAGQVFARQQVH